MQSYENIKVPYPKEGVIRTAQIDDTVTPEDSVQLAVNMNFDRVGAAQTRLGVSTYATQLVDEINNFGTLRNSIIPDGFKRIAQIGADKEIAGEFENPSAVLLNSTHIVVFWSGADNDGFCRVFEIDTTNGEITAVSDLVEFETGTNSENCCIKVSSTIVMNVWQGVSGDGFVQCFQVTGSGDSWTITPAGSALEFDASNAQYFSMAQVDSNHFILFYTGSNDDGIATIFEVNLGTLAVTEPGSPLTFDSGVTVDHSCAALGNGTHFINFWGFGGKVQAFSVNTGTWAITAIGTPLSYDTNGADSSCVSLGDGEHFVNFYYDTSGDGFAQAFNVDPSTFAVTTVGTGVIFESGSLNDISAVALTGTHLCVFWRSSNDDGFGQLVDVEALTFNLSLVGPQIGTYDFGADGSPVTLFLSSSRVAVIWGIDGDTIGYGAIFKMQGDVVNGRWLYAQVADEVQNWDGASWTVRRSGLAEVSKARFSQFLNYIWMVNGNQYLGGDPVATSNGGDFGDDLVPEGFPAGDFIHAGFEGRIWVVDKTTGILYYTDIVQFIPPDVYTVSFDADVNFIKDISPQDGQSPTALYRVPRALLLFTEDSIYRIYGATSIDAYPAYNVGTFSQESIVETKTGIFFHHSSGFYQFDYGSQPVEISRRIIDFVQAIPRSAYENITGVYDNFDAVEWAVGTVTVEGVTFTNCVLRYTISTQVWTIYDYVGNVITAMISYDDGTTLNHLMGTSAGKVGAMDSGNDDFGSSFYYEIIDRWRSFLSMYGKQKSIDGINVYSENAAGANFTYQVQKSGPNVWEPIGTVTEANNSLMPNNGTIDFDVVRFRLAGNTKGTPVVFHGYEILSITDKGFNQN